jgi:hypothetical protein
MDKNCRFCLETLLYMLKLLSLHFNLKERQKN